MAADGRPGLRRWLETRYDRKGEALYAFGAGFVAVALGGAVAYAFDQPLILLALGPTVHLFFVQPLALVASPRSAVTGHLVALSVGFLSLSLFGLVETSHVTPGDPFFYVYTGPTALAVGLTGAILVAARAWHHPAGVAAVVVGLGMLDELRDFSFWPPRLCYSPTPDGSSTGRPGCP